MASGFVRRGGIGFAAEGGAACGGDAGFAGRAGAQGGGTGFAGGGPPDPAEGKGPAAAGRSRAGMTPAEATLALFFVIDGVALEGKALPLAASIAVQAARDPRLRAIAYVPGPFLPALRPESRTVLARCGVEIRELPAPGRLWRRPYPHGNKIIAAAEPREAAVSVFLDTDMLVTGPLDALFDIAPGEVGLVPEGVPSWGRDGDRWARAYAHFGLELPTERVRLTRRRRISFLPYFNAGLVAFREDHRVDGQGFGALWRETARDLDHNCAIGQKRPWLDQIALPLTLRRFGLAYKLLPERYNFSISDRPAGELPADGGPPAVVHYHRIAYFAAWPEHWQAALAGLAARTRPEERAPVAALLAEAGFGTAGALHAALDR